jgi:SAM-dependent methyltransferase
LVRPAPVGIIVQMVQDEISAYYRRMGELTRLASGVGRLEFLRTWDIITRELPPAPVSILDVGGATGVYAGPLAAAGYRVHLVDPILEQVAAAAELPGVTATVGDARDLDQTDASVDAVLMFGPLYHLHDRADRVRAWSEARRVLRPGGLAVAATISRFASFLDGVSREFAQDPEFRAVTDRDLTDGRHLNPAHVPGWFTTAYFQHTDEIPGEVADAGLMLDRIVAVETAAAFAGPRLAEMLEDPELFAWAMAAMRRIETEPTLLGATPHALTIAHRR